MAESQETSAGGEPSLSAETDEFGQAEHERTPAAVAATMSESHGRGVDGSVDDARVQRAPGDEQQPASPVTDAAIAAAPVAQPEPVAAATDPVAPVKRSNRLFATGLVLLSALLFEVVYLGLVELVAFIIGGASAEGPALQGVIGSGLVWLPLVVFAVLYELVVLLLNRAGRFAYVVASLVVGLLVYVAAILFVLIAEAHAVTAAGFAQLLVNPLFILAGLAAREVMLWTGFAVGAHGKRLRRKNREARQEYEHERADAA